MFGKDIDVQWGRQCSVVFKDYDTKLFTLINDYEDDEEKFRVEFEYTKSFDESKHDSNGTVKIYGLTLDRFKVLGEPYKAEIELYFGYAYSESNPLKLLFEAVIVDKSYEHSNGGSVSTFKVLGDFYGKVSTNTGDMAGAIHSQAKTVGSEYIAKGSSTKFEKSFPENTKLLQVLDVVSKDMGFSAYAIKDNTGVLFDKYYLVEGLHFPLGLTLYGTPKQSIGELCEAFKMTWSTSGTGKEKILVMEFTDEGLERLLNSEPSSATTSKDKSITNESDSKKVNANKENVNLMTSHAIVLNRDTGLLGIPAIKTKTVTRSYSEALQANESIKEQKAITVKRNKKGEPVVDKKTGEIKYKVPKTKKVYRRQVLARCFINSNIIPKSQVIIETEQDNDYINGLYRVRNVKITGDSGGDACYMELELDGDVTI